MLYNLFLCFMYLHQELFSRLLSLLTTHTQKVKHPELQLLLETWCVIGYLKSTYASGQNNFEQTVIMMEFPWFPAR